jgi:hypothetical protein
LDSSGGKNKILNKGVVKMALSKKDIETLGEMFDNKIEKHKPIFTCPNGITPETAQGIKDLVSIMNNGKKTATTVIVSSFILGIISLALAGFWSKISSVFK